MKYVIFEDNYIGCDGSWRNVCHVVDTLSELVKRELPKDLILEHCYVFACEDEYEVFFKKFYKRYWELEDKIISIVGLMPSKNDDELTLEERAQIDQFENQILQVYGEALNSAISMGLKMMSLKDIECQIEKENNNEDDGLYIVTHTVYDGCGVEVFVDGVFPFAKASRIAKTINNAQIRRIKVGERQTFMAGYYYE